MGAPSVPKSTYIQHQLLAPVQPNTCQAYTWLFKLEAYEKVPLAVAVPAKSTVNKACCPNFLTLRQDAARGKTQISRYQKFLQKPISDVTD